MKGWPNRRRLLWGRSSLLKGLALPVALLLVITVAAGFYFVIPLFSGSQNHSHEVVSDASGSVQDNSAQNHLSPNQNTSNQSSYRDVLKIASVQACAFGSDKYIIQFGSVGFLCRAGEYRPGYAQAGEDCRRRGQINRGPFPASPRRKKDPGPKREREKSQCYCNRFIRRPCRGYDPLRKTFSTIDCVRLRASLWAAAPASAKTQTQRLLLLQDQ